MFIHSGLLWSVASQPVTRAAYKNMRKYWGTCYIIISRLTGCSRQFIFMKFSEVDDPRPSPYLFLILSTKHCLVENYGNYQWNIPSSLSLCYFSEWTGPLRLVLFYQPRVTVIISCINYRIQHHWCNVIIHQCNNFRWTYLFNYLSVSLYLSCNLCN